MAFGGQREAKAHYSNPYSSRLLMLFGLIPNDELLQMWVFPSTVHKNWNCKTLCQNSVLTEEI